MASSHVYLPYRIPRLSSVHQASLQFQRALLQISLPWVPPRSFCISVWCLTFSFAARRKIQQKINYIICEQVIGRIRGVSIMTHN